MAAAEVEEGCLGLAANAEVLALLRTRAAEAGGESELSGGDRRLMEYLKGVRPSPSPPPFGVTPPCPARSSIPPARAMVLPSPLASNRWRNGVGFVFPPVLTAAPWRRSRRRLPRWDGRGRRSFSES